MSEFISVVHKRSKILNEICQGVEDKRTLAENLPMSRPTVDRAVRELEEYSLVSRNGGYCSPTDLGQMICQFYDEIETTFEGLLRVGEMINSLPDDTIELSIFKNSEIHY